MGIKVTALAVCAGWGLALVAGCQRGAESPIPDEPVYDQQGNPELPNVPPSPDVHSAQGRRVSPPPGGTVVPARASLDPAEKHVRGKVRYVGPRTVKIEDDQARWFELELTSDTRVTWNGRNASALTFVDGTLLDATYRLSNGELLATNVEVLAVPE